MKTRGNIRQLLSYMGGGRNVVGSLASSPYPPFRHASQTNAGPMHQAKTTNGTPMTTKERISTQ